MSAHELATTPDQTESFVLQGSQAAIMATLTDIWRECFDGAELDVDSDFFELGGDSLKAIMLIGLCNDRFSATLEPQALLESSTIRKLVPIIAAASRAREGDGLVTFRKGVAAGSILLIHPIGGSVFCYGDLVSNLALERSVYGIRAMGLRAGDVLPASIEAMAEQYCSWVRACGASLPFHIVGWSFGGLVGFEMSRQLECAGKPAASLTLIDTPLPTTRLGADDDELFIRTTAAALLVKIPAARAELPSLDDLLRTAVERGDLAMTSETARRTADVIRNALRLRKGYVARPLNGAVTVIRASVDPIAAVEDYGWEALVNGPVRHFDVPATHETIVQGEAARAVARIVNEWLSAPELAR